jgi:multiple antibiotic resistance protein
LALAILVVHLILFLCLRYSGLVIRLIKESGIELMAKIAGLLLAAIAVQLVANAIRGFIAGGS